MGVNLDVDSNVQERWTTPDSCRASPAHSATITGNRIASGKKAASDGLYHGGSRRGGYGHGLAADLVSVKGETCMQRYASSKEIWKWIDAHEKELGIGRPYLNRDPPMSGRSARSGGPPVSNEGLFPKEQLVCRTEAILLYAPVREKLQ
jgi:hypothetical protein